MDDPQFSLVASTGDDSKDLSSDPAMAHIRRGFFMHLEDDAQIKPWTAWQVVARARVHCVHEALSKEHVFTGHSALVLHGVEEWITNPNVQYWSPSSWNKSSCPQVTLTSARVPRVTVQPTRTRPASGNWDIVDGIPCESLVDAAVRMACTCHPLIASVAVSSILARLSGFNTFDQPASRQREAEIRKQMLVCLDTINPPQGTRLARTIITAADAGCANVSEAALLWVVAGVYPGQIVTQLPIYIRGQVYFADIALPDLRIIIEFDGREKLGETTAQFRQAQRDWMQRQRALEQAGWKVLRFNWEDFEDFAQLRRRILSFLGTSFRTLPAATACLWKEPSKQIDGSDRRFHVRRPGLVKATDEPPR